MMSKENHEYYCTPIKLAKIKNTSNARCYQGYETKKLSCISDRKAKWKSFRKTLDQLLKKSNIQPSAHTPECLFQGNEDVADMNTYIHEYL